MIGRTFSEALRLVKPLVFTFEEQIAKISRAMYWNLSARGKNGQFNCESVIFQTLQSRSRRCLPRRFLGC